MTFTPPSIPGAAGYPLALTGATSATRYVGGTTSGAPASGTFAVGDFIIDQTGSVYVCTVAGSPGTWVAAGGGGLARGSVSLTGGDITTASTSFVDLTGATITITTGARRVLLTLSGAWLNSVAGNGQNLTFLVDGTNQGGTNGLHFMAAPGNSFEANPSLVFQTAVLTAASHTFKVQWRVTAGTGTFRASSAVPIVFTAMEQPYTT